jgi:phage terminase large subunit GpA-like protein
MTFHSIEAMVVASAEAVRPPERLTVSQAAEKYHIVNNPGTHVGPFSNERTPYLVEPMDELQSLEFTGEIFCGPARCGKSVMALNWLASTAICDPADMMFVNMTQNTARDWSQGDLAKMVRYSPEVKRRLVPGRQNDNVHDKRFLSGMRLLIKWPTISELSGKTIPRLWLFDRDRMDDNIDKEGDPFDLARKRAQTYRRFGMTVAESSPGREVTNSKWLPTSPHEAPPTTGILALYNRGDRRRWYWRCPQCNDPFEGDFKLLRWPQLPDPMEAAQQVVMECPSCGFPIPHEMKHELNQGGKWIKEGQTWEKDGSVSGIPRRSDIASFWLKGPAAAFISWPELVLKYLNALDDYERTGSEEALKVTVNVDQGLPYTSKSAEAGRLPDELRARAQHYSDKGEVPPGVGFLVTTIDVQAGGRPSFVCHTYGIGPGVSQEQLEQGIIPPAADIWHVDMWKIRKSNRIDTDGERKLIDPASYPEDWDCLIDEVLLRTYPLSDGSGRHMAVKIVACDSGGAAAQGNAKKNDNKDGPKVSVTANAYEFWRRLKRAERANGEKIPASLHLRFHLVKGSPSNSAPEMHRTYPDSGQKDRFAIARGDVPVYLVNSNKVKDRTSNLLGRTDPGGQIHFPVWYDENEKVLDIGWLYTQLTTEVRTARGWENPSRRKNEAFDLLAYCIAICLTQQIRLEHIDWTKPPPWANPDWDNNDLVINPVDHDAADVLAGAKPNDDPDIEDLAEQLG